MFEWLGFVKSLPVESEVALSESLVVDGVPVMRSHCDCFEASGLVNDSSVQDGIIEGVIGESSLCVLNCQTCCVSSERSQGNSEISVIVFVVYPPSEGQLALDDLIE